LILKPTNKKTIKENTKPELIDTFNLSTGAKNKIPPFDGMVV
jgi:hypothetical protein